MMVFLLVMLFCVHEATPVLILSADFRKGKIKSVWNSHFLPHATGLR